MSRNDRHQDDERFFTTLIKRGYIRPSIRKLRDGSWVASIKLGKSLWETHTGLDVYGHRVRYVFDSILRVMLSRDQVSSVNDEPTGWIKRIPVPRYLGIGIAAHPKMRHRFGLFVGPLKENSRLKYCELFLDDKDGNGMARFVARARELGVNDSMLRTCESIKARNWNPIHDCALQKKKST